MNTTRIEYKKSTILILVNKKIKKCEKLVEKENNMFSRQKLSNLNCFRTFLTGTSSTTVDMDFESYKSLIE